MRSSRLPAAFLVLLLAAVPAAAAELTWEAAEAAGLRIGEVRIATGDVFDLGRPDEDHWLGRAANVIHVTTRPSVVRGALLFAAGEPVRAALVRESERRLRALPWMVDAAIEPVRAGPERVDAVVRAHDGWSLSLSLKYNHAGGDAQWSLWADERNLFGLGKEVLVSRDKDLERHTTEFAYKDPFLLGSAWRLEAAYQDLSDGTGRRALLALPFARLDSPWSLGVEAAERELTETIYDDGSDVYSFPATLREGRAFVQRRYAFADRTAYRAGLEFRVREASYGALAVERQDTLAPPDLASRRLRGLLATWAVSQDRYETCRNLRSVCSTEDVNLGWEATAALGWAGRALGGDREAWLAEGSAKAGARLPGGLLLLLDGSGRARVEEGGARDALARLHSSLYWQGLPLQTLAADLDLAWGRRLDPESTLYLGGFDGLRGYPNHLRAGERRWILSLEDRVVTPWRLWGIAQVGFVAYADAGAIDTPAGGFTRTFADVGFGLRFGNLKGTVARVVVLTVAFPLVRGEGISSVQVVAGNTLRF